MKLFELLEYVQSEGKRLDDITHDMSTGESMNADFNRSMAWARAVSYYDVAEKIKKFLGLEEK